MFVPFEDPLAESSDSPQRRKRAMQLILDEIHGLQKGWELDGDEWAGAGIINSSTVLVVTVSDLVLDPGCRINRMGQRMNTVQRAGGDGCLAVLI
jgi:hypothetical protein